MGWQDRPYYRDQGSSPSNPLLWLFSGSIPLFTAFRIRVRMHMSLVLLIVIGLLFSTSSSGMGFTNALTFYGVLFSIILLHEFGHCFAARWMGGDADEIIMWPLGGLALTGAPSRPWPQLVTTAGGPLVNLIICAVTAAAAMALNWGHPHIQFNPLSHSYDVPKLLTAQYYLWWIFAVSWGLFLFNLLPIFPMDGGRMLQDLLWFKLGYYKATLIACVVGMAGAALMSVWGVMNFGSWYGMVLIFLGISCFIYCYQTRAQMKAEGPWAFEEESNDYSAAMWKPDEVDEPVKKKSKRLSPRAVKKLRKQAHAEEAEQARLDAILAKVSAHGMQSLTWAERRALHKATQRQREVELSKDLD
jgi:stage IV sporulation protein FB